MAERIEAHTYVQLQCVDDDREGPRLRRYWRGHYLGGLDGPVIDAFVSRGVPHGDEPHDGASIVTDDPSPSTLEGEGAEIRAPLP